MKPQAFHLFLRHNLSPVLLRAVCIILLLIFLLIAPASAFEVMGLKTPESFITDPVEGGYFISNINGQPTDKDNNGFITKLDREGKIIHSKFVEGNRDGVTLHAPKGMAIVGDILYVTDIDRVRGFNKNSGEAAHDLDLSEFSPRFLNDITSDPDGNLYVTDMMTHMILKIETAIDHQTSVLVQDPALGGPNGIIFDAANGRLIVVTWDSGAILEVRPDGQYSELMNSKGLKNLDGVGVDEGGNIYTSSFTDGRIYKISPDFKKVKIFREGLTTPADINLDLTHRLVLIPFFKADKARTERFR